MKPAKHKRYLKTYNIQQRTSENQILLLFVLLSRFGSKCLTDLPDFGISYYTGELDALRIEQNL